MPHAHWFGRRGLRVLHLCIRLSPPAGGENRVASARARLKCSGSERRNGTSLVLFLLFHARIGQTSPLLFPQAISLDRFRQSAPKGVL